MKNKDWNPSKPGLTILITALNEEKVIEVTIREAFTAAKEVLNEFELILVNDGSDDCTGGIMDTYAKSHSEVQVIHHPNNFGLGYTFREGIELAAFDYYIVIPGDHSFNFSGVKALLGAIGNADYIIGARANRFQALPFTRVLISNILRLYLILLSRRKIPDYSTISIYPVKILRELNLEAPGYAFQIEVTLKLLRRNVSIMEVPILLNNSPAETSKAINIRTLLDIAKTIWLLLWEK